MAQKPIAMEQLKQILQLKKDGVSIREMSRRVGISRNSVRKYLSLLERTDTSSDGELARDAGMSGILSKTKFLTLGQHAGINLLKD